ncbi:MAG: hypothetical protein K8U57_40310 [Planctomycetes bacterium]|nr:hypothetical protein [Planctomycetota bacterium]
MSGTARKQDTREGQRGTRWLNWSALGTLHGVTPQSRYPPTGEFVSRLPHTRQSGYSLEHLRDAGTRLSSAGVGLELVGIMNPPRRDAVAIANF